MTLHESARKRRSSSAEWCDLIERTAKESDPQRLAHLLRKLCDILSQEQGEARSQAQSSRRKP